MNPATVTAKYLWLCFLMLVIAVRFPVGAQEDVLRHEIDVSVHILPFYALDQQDHPILDLNERDLSLFVNDKAIPFQLLRYDFSSPGSESQLPPSFKTQNTSENTSNRVILLIFDTMYNTAIGLDRSKEIARHLIEERAAGDYFIIMEITSSRGLQHIVGPERQPGKLLEIIEGIKTSPDLYTSYLFSLVGRDAAATRPMDGDPPALTRLWVQHKISTEQATYINNIRPFAESLGTLSHILRLIEMPRTVILFSEGIARGAFRKSTRSTLYRLLKNAVQAISTTGALLYTINPQQQDPYTQEMETLDSGDHSLQLLAETGGGKYLEAPAVRTLADMTRSSLSAYYELVFSADIDAGQRKNVRIVCSRPNVSVTTTREFGVKVDYRQMDAMGKKVFILHTILQNKLAFNTGKLVPVSYSLQSSGSQPGNDKIQLTVHLPETVHGKKLDAYVLFIEPQNGKHQIDVQAVEGTGDTAIIIKNHPQQRCIFAFIDPDSGRIFSNELRLPEISSGETAGQLDKKAREIPSNNAGFLSTVGGFLDIVDDDGDLRLRLSGHTIHTADQPVYFRKIVQYGDRDLVLLEQRSNPATGRDTAFLALSISAAGDYEISTPLSADPGSLSITDEKIITLEGPLTIDHKGSVAIEHRDFHDFFVRFKHDKNFQRSRIVFPFKNQRYDPRTRACLSSRQIERDEWEFTRFHDAEPAVWSDARIESDRAEIQLKGSGLHIKIFFQKIDHTWMLIRSENWSVSEQ